MKTIKQNFWPKDEKSYDLIIWGQKFESKSRSSVEKVFSLFWELLSTIYLGYPWLSWWILITNITERVQWNTVVFDGK